MEFKYKINPRLLILLMIGIVMTCSSYLTFVYQPLQLIMKKVASLGPGTVFLKLWQEPPFSVFIDAYIFNVTNAEGFLKRKEKLKVNQIGPYVYQEILMNKNPIFNDNGTMTYQPKRYLRFRPDLSVGNPDEERVISPNIPLVGIQASLQDASPWKNFLLSSASKLMGAKGFINITVSEYLWGYEDPLVKQANRWMSSWINFDKFGIFDRLMALDNATNVVTLNLHPELENTSPLLTEAERHAPYHIQRWNGSPGLKQWGYVDTEANETAEQNSRCNMVEGSFEGTVFPPNLKENSTVKLYRRAFCRPVPFNYVKEATTADGYRGLKFEVDDLFLATPEENPENACYCVKGKSLRKGLGSLAPCYYDIPITISQPHFLNSDPWLLQQIEGMEPNASAHGSSFILHPELGVPLEADLRIQINLDVGQTRSNSITEPFNGLVIPLFWLQLKLGEIPGSINALITLLFYVLPVVQEILIYLLGLGGLGLMSASSLFYLFFSDDEPNSRLSFRRQYRPLPLIPMSSPYFTPEIKLLK